MDSVLTHVWTETDLESLRTSLRSRPDGKTYGISFKHLRSSSYDPLPMTGTPDEIPIHFALYCEYEDLPLCINVKDALSQVILQWRLEHGC